MGFGMKFSVADFPQEDVDVCGKMLPPVAHKVAGEVCKQNNAKFPQELQYLKPVMCFLQKWVNCTVSYSLTLFTTAGLIS